MQGQLRILAIALAWLLSGVAARGQVQIRDYVKLVGTVESISPGSLVIKDEVGHPHKLLVQESGEPGVSLSNGIVLRFPAKIDVHGHLDAAALQVGQTVRVVAPLNRLGRSDGEVSEVWLVDGEDAPDGVRVLKEGDSPSDFARCEIVGPIQRVANQRLTLTLKRNDVTRKTQVTLALSPAAEVRFQSDNLRRATAGARVTHAVAAKLNSGDLVVKELRIDVTAGPAEPSGLEDQHAAKYRHLSDEPPDKPRLIRSRHFAFMSDVSDRQAQIILDKLETMTELLTQYFQRAPQGPVEGFVVRDLSHWPEGVLVEPYGIAKIREGAGICFSRSLGSQRRATLYSCADHGVIQHECTHGLCHLMFGSTGPTWLAEGVAEMGQYWKKDQREVDVGPTVMTYLQKTPTKKRLLEIAIPGRQDAGTWRDYAWRWALCHLLANNPNYAPRFKPLAVALMQQQEGVSFASVYGPVAKEISFEYDLFLQSLDNGYRADLCAWQWQVKAKPIPPGRHASTTVKADYGWQASGMLLSKDKSYEVRSVGEWAVNSQAGPVTADGDAQQRGRLEAVIFHDFQLTPVIPLGTSTRFTAPADGQLILRCRDDWNQLSDNEGELRVHVREASLMPTQLESRTN